MSPTRRVGAVLLFALAVATGWALWLLRDRPDPETLTGPPRSDYQLEQFELVALDANGKEAFSVTGPRLSRHPWIGSLTIAQPRLSFPDSDGGTWTGRADAAAVNAEADLLVLERNVLIEGPRPPDPPLQLASERLEFLPDDNELRSELEVTVTGAGSILRGRGLRADLDARRFDLLADVRGRHEPQR